MGEQDCSTLCAPDLSLMHTTLTRFYGRIYASRSAKNCGVSPWSSDPIIPTRYLDFEAMKIHKFIKATTTYYNYKLMVNKKSIVDVILPVPSLFVYEEKGT